MILVVYPDYPRANPILFALIHKLIVALLARRYVLTENLHASKQDGANWFTALYGKDDPNALRIQTIAPFCDFALAHALGAKVCIL